jgi:hypothetical protein
MNPKRAIALAILAVGVASITYAQESSPSRPGIVPSIGLPIGLEVGQRVPTFAARDQFGHEQSNATLKGSKGTLLLFFRSADW